MMRQLLLTLTAIEFSECPGVMGSIDVSKMSKESNGEIFGGTICFGIPLFMFNGLCHGAIFWKCEAENPVSVSCLPQNPKVCHL